MNGPLTHWQDFNDPVTIAANTAGDMYRAAHSIKATLRMVADYHLCINGEQPTRFTKSEIEAMLSGALALAEMLNVTLEELHI